MKTTNHKPLSFQKKSIMELDLASMRGIVGGADTTLGQNEQTTYACGDCIVLPSAIRNLTKF